MRWFRFSLFVIAVTLIQAGLVDIISLVNVRPDLLLILLVFFAIYCDTTEAIISSFAIGFAADIIGSAMGPQMISFGLFGTLLGTSLYSAIIGPFLFLPSAWLMRIKTHQFVGS
jgi:rod shape-determining protein MreD